MGPGCFYPGNARYRSAPRILPWLQWGRDVSIPEMSHVNQSFVLRYRFNGAGMFLSRKYVLKTNTLPSLLSLQWGRDVSGDIAHFPPSQVLIAVIASMGPGC